MYSHSHTSTSCTLHVCMHTCTHPPHTHARTHTRTHARTHTHTHTHTRTHTHTHAQIYTIQYIHTTFAMALIFGRASTMYNLLECLLAWMIAYHGEKQFRCYKYVRMSTQWHQQASSIHAVHLNVLLIILIALWHGTNQWLAAPRNGRICYIVEPRQHLQQTMWNTHNSHKTSNNTVPHNLTGILPLLLKLATRETSSSLTDLGTASCTMEEAEETPSSIHC